MTVLAVVVTHNRCALLSRCLDHVAQQTRPPDSVLVVDNASSDGTRELLWSRGVELITQENLGSAGGWHRGIQYAIDNGYHSVWLMDDDGFPAHNALELLEAALEPGTSCVSSVVLQEANRTEFVFPFPHLNRNGLPVIFGRARKIPNLMQLSREAQSGRYPFAHLFNGALVSVDAAKQIGNVNRDFFMSGDEVDYFFRLRAVGHIYSLLAAHHYHPDIAGRPLSSPKLYYYVKNTIVLNHMYFDHAWVRNVLTVAAALGRTAARNGWAAALSYAIGAQRRVMLSAVRRGLRKQIGRDFND